MQAAIVASYDPTLILSSLLIVLQGLIVIIVVKTTMMGFILALVLSTRQGRDQQYKKLS